MTKQARSKLAQQAQLALLYEVTCLNKPGLVDPVDAGAHQDMDVFTFLESSVVLTPYFETFVQAGTELRHLPIEATFRTIRQVGLEAERAMFEATEGINTHKGAIFSRYFFSYLWSFNDLGDPLHLTIVSTNASNNDARLIG